MKKLEFIYEEGAHRWAVVARDPERPGYVVDTNEYLVIDGDEALLMDPGGSEIFASVFAAIGNHFDPERIRWLFASHQDPDVISSLALWLSLRPDLKCYASWLWSSFLPHYGGTESTFIPIADGGQSIPLGSSVLEAVPAHYLHSPGNFQLYDPKAKILFSGDVGAALLPAGEGELFVRSFDRHIRHATLFHKRWMGSNEAKLRWCERAESMEIEMLCPQHGAIYQGKDVQRFISWFADLEIGLR